MKAERIIAALACAFVVCSAGAAEKVAKPRKLEVVVIGRILLEPGIDDVFFSKYGFLRGRETKLVPPTKGEPGQVTRSVLMLRVPEKFSGDSEYRCYLGDIFFFKIRLPSDRRVSIPSFMVMLSGVRYLKVELPFRMETVIPDGENYVYVGTFIYRREGNLFKIVEVSRLDEYEEAKKAVTERYGPDAELVRVPFRSFDPN